MIRIKQGLLSITATCVILFAFLALPVTAQEHLPKASGKFDQSIDEWGKIVRKNAPEKPTVEPAGQTPRKVLVFSLFTGYDHKVIPFADKAVEILGEKSGAFTATITTDIEMLSPSNLAKYDVLVLNNNCSRGPRRNLLLDELERNPKYKQWSEQQRTAKSNALKKSMLDYVASGKGLVVLHGGLVLLNNDPEFVEMVGGAFWYHPKAQEVTLDTVEPNHPLVAAFKGKTPFTHTDEPYLFNKSYTQGHFRPLLIMDASKIKAGRRGLPKHKCYVSWIKPHGKGRVFYCSPSHFQESYESPTILRFLLDGMQYAAGDLKCDDTPMKGGIVAQQ